MWFCPCIYFNLNSTPIKVKSLTPFLTPVGLKTLHFHVALPSCRKESRPVHENVMFITLDKRSISDYWQAQVLLILRLPCVMLDSSPKNIGLVVCVILMNNISMGRPGWDFTHICYTDSEVYADHFNNVIPTDPAMLIQHLTQSALFCMIPSIPTCMAPLTNLLFSFLLLFHKGCETDQG